MDTNPNPYLPPTTEVASTQFDVPLENASKGRRFGTLLVDYVCYLALSVLLGVFIGLVFGREGVAMVESVNKHLLGIVLLLSYYLFFEGIWARTPGKLVFGTVVVNESGHRPSFGQILGRSLCRFIPFEPFSCLTERGWHDSIPKTRVVRNRPQ